VIDSISNYFIFFKRNYTSYKAKLQKGKTLRQKKDPHDAATVLDSIGKLTEKIKTRKDQNPDSSA
jgi:hypothetical protein